jgi:hypothetical protein
MDASYAIIAALSCGFTFSSQLVARASEVSVQQIEAARTAADHEAIASAYEKEAAQLDARAKDHTDMLRFYMIGELEDIPSVISMREHCDRRSKQHSEAAAEARKMAAMHRAMAQTH